MLFFNRSRAKNLPTGTRLSLKLKELWLADQEIVTNPLSDHGQVTFFFKSQIVFLGNDGLAQVMFQVLPPVMLREWNSIWMVQIISIEANVQSVYHLLL